MIAPITKEYFYKKAGTPTNWIKKKDFELKAVLEKENRWRWNDVLYFEKLGENNIVFIYLAEYRVLAIPDIYSTSEVTIDEREDVFFGDWKLEVLDNSKIDHRYTINVFHRSTRYCYDSLNTYFSAALKDCSRRSRICLINDRIGFRKEVEIYKEDQGYSKSFYIGYPEKLEVPLDTSKVYETDDELSNIILWTQNKQ